MNFFGLVILLAFVDALAVSTPSKNTNESRLLVRLGPGEISLGDLDASALSIPIEYRAGFFQDPERIGKHLETLVVRRALAQQALEEPGAADLGLADIHAQLVEKKLIEEQFRRLREGLPPPDYETRARELYDANIEDFKLAEAVSVSHVLIAVKSRSDAEALELASSVLSMASEGSQPFSELVAEYSDDPGKASNKGRYEHFARGAMVKPFEDAAFAMNEPGELAGPVKTRFGYHIIQFHERFTDTYQSFEDARLTLVDRARKELRKQQDDQLLATFENPDHDLLVLARQNKIADEPLFEAQVRLEADEAIVRKYKQAFLASGLPESFETLAREQYLTNKSEFLQPLQVTIQLLHVSAGEIGIEAARIKARGLAASARDAKIKFEQLVEDHSDDSLKFSNGGKYLFEAGKDKHRLAQQALELSRIGQIAGPFETENGLDLIKLLAREDARSLPFEEVRDNLIARIKSKLEGRLWEARVYEVKLQEFWADKELVASIRNRYLPEAPQ